MASHTLTLLFLFASLAFPAKPRTGRVVNRLGEPVISAEVRLSRSGAADLIADLETDENGAFELPGLPPAEYRIQVSKPDYVPQTVILKPTEEPAQPILIRLVRCGVISGTVLDAQGRPVPSATVFAVVESEPKAPMRRLADAGPGRLAQVDADGSYRLYGLPPGQYGLAVTYGASTQNVSRTGDSTTGPNGSGVLFYPADGPPKLFRISDGDEYPHVDFTISPGALYRITGHVEGAGSFVIALTADNQPAFATAVTQSTPDGAFHFDGIPPGSYTLFASGTSLSRGPLGFEPETNSPYGHLSLQIASDVEGVTVPVQPPLFAALQLKNSDAASACTQPIQFILAPYVDSAMDLTRKVTVGFTQPTRVGPLPPGRYLLTSNEKDASCKLAGNGVIDLSSQGIIYVPISSRNE